MAQKPAQQNGAEALLKSIKDLLDTLETNLTTKFAAQIYELKVQNDALRQEVVVLQNIVSEKKKPAAKAAAKTATAETVTVEGGAATAVEKKPFPTSVGAYFARLYKDTGAEGNTFRAKYITDAMKTDLDKEEEIKAKKNADVRANAEARWLHAHLKLKNKQLADQFNAEFLAAKKEHAEASKPAQQTVEPDTPPTTD